MLKAFLSHSSSDKGYVEKVAQNLTTNWCVYDAFSFEEASETAEEIVKNISSSSIFVFFISKKSLESEWVKKELEKVHDLMKNGEFKKILPIIIDDNITHKHPLIPSWLKDNYNIQPIKKYKKAIHRIRQELLRLSWKISSSQKEKDNLFVGRNKLIDELEGIYRENDVPPLSVIASGINGIGRRSLIKEYMQKVGIAEKSKYVSTITLEINESIEDFILKLDDLGFSSIEIDVRKISKLKLEEKVSLLYSILTEIQNENELVIIEDSGCIVLPDRSLNHWFEKLLEEDNKNKKIKKFVLSIISKYRLNKHILIKAKNIYAIDVPELEAKEIDWIFKDLLRIYNLELSKIEYSLIRNLLYGHPEQILYAIDLLRLEGYQYICDDPHLLVDFNFQKMSYLLAKYKDNEIAKSLLAMLSKFDFIDYELLNELIGGNQTYVNLMHQFISESICNEIGSNRETIKLNRAIRDSIRRSDWQPTKDLNNSVKKHIATFLSSYKEEEKSLSDYFYSMQELLINQPHEIDVSIVIPSHILKTIATLYDVQHKWKSVIALATNVLYENFNNLDEQIENQIRKYLCLAYIRNKDNELFLAEVQKISGSGHSFLLGFYYRTNGRYDEAIIKLRESLSENPNFAKAKRELVQVYLSTHDYETALELAKENYNIAKQNPYLFQAYSTCLIKTYNKAITREEEINSLFSSFKQYGEDSTRSREMYDIENAKFIAHKNDNSALGLINDAIGFYPDSIYPKIAKFDIAEKLSNIDEMESILQVLKLLEDSLPNKSLIVVNEAILNAKKGNMELAKMRIEQLRNYPEKSKNMLLERLNSMNGSK